MYCQIGSKARTNKSVYSIQRHDMFKVKEWENIYHVNQNIYHSNPKIVEVALFISGTSEQNISKYKKMLFCHEKEVNLSRGYNNLKCLSTQLQSLNIYGAKSHKTFRSNKKIHNYKQRQ